MATLASGLHIPNEIIINILRHFLEEQDLKNLSAISRVSKNWYKMAFPYLHRHMTVKTTGDLAWLISRLRAEQSNDALCLGGCVRSLTFELDAPTRLSPSLTPLMSNFGLTIYKFVRLRTLRWLGLYYAPWVSWIFQAFRDSCSDLHTIKVESREYCEDDDIEIEAPCDEVFGFANMKHIDITWFQQSADPDGVPGELINMVENSPNLVELSLRLSTPSVDLICNLQNPMARLRQLVLWGSVPESENSYSCSLGDFFLKHPHIIQLQLYWPINSPEPLHLTRPELTYQAFSSLKSFHGPVAISSDLVTSKVSEQLESLIVVQTYSCPLDFSESVGALIKNTRPLPKLKELQILGWRTPDAVMMGRLALDKLLAATPALESLNIIYFTTRWNDLVKALKHVPLLENLEIGFIQSRRLLTPQNMMKIVAFHARVHCPKLRQVTLRLIGSWQRRKLIDGEESEYIIAGGGVIKTILYTAKIGRTMIEVPV